MTSPRLTDPELTAVIVPREEHAGWLDELAELVVTRRLVIARTTLTAASLDDFARWSRTALADTTRAVSGPLLDDMTGIVEQVMATADVGRVMVRVFTEAPTRRCGFHVDTVPPQAPTIGAVRVYNGPTTEYVACDDVESMAAFYTYLSRRERLSQAAGAGACSVTAAGSAPGQLIAMDEAPSFLRPRAPVHRVPRDATVYFKHIDVRQHWSPHPVTDVWIHRSPTTLEGDLTHPATADRSGTGRDRPAHRRDRHRGPRDVAGRCCGGAPPPTSTTAKALSRWSRVTKRDTTPTTAATSSRSGCMQTRPTKSLTCGNGYGASALACASPAKASSPANGWGVGDG